MKYLSDQHAKDIADGLSFLDDNGKENSTRIISVIIESFIETMNTFYEINEYSKREGFTVISSLIEKCNEAIAEKARSKLLLGQDSIGNDENAN